MDMTTSTRFLDGRRTVLAALLSVLAILVLAMYVAAPGNGNISFGATSKASASTTVDGLVTNEDGGAVSDAKVQLTFTKAGKPIKTVAAKIAKDGRFTAKAPKGATGVKVAAAKGSRRGSRSYSLKRGRSLKVGVKIPKRGGLFVNLIPAFPF